MAAPKRRRPMQSYPMDPDLIVGLAKLAKIERVPMASIVRRALRRELEERGVIKPRGKIFGPTSRPYGRTEYKSREEAQESARPGDEVRLTPRGTWVIKRRLR